MVINNSLWFALSIISSPKAVANMTAKAYSADTPLLAISSTSLF